jgi:PKD repeat protein
MPRASNLRYSGPVRLAWTIFLAGLAGCGGSGHSSDASIGEDALTPSEDATPQSDSGPSLGWVDYAVSGCSTGSGTAQDPCIGTAALSLRFSVLAPSAVSELAWDFGDGSTSDAFTPTHVYREPGLYTVRLDVAGPGGTAGVAHIASVQVVPAPLGAGCTADAVCESNQCLCPQGSCPSPLENGFCTLDCANNAECPSSSICGNLDPSSAGMEIWQKLTCLPNCQSTAECPANTTCLTVLDADGTWQSACFAPAVLRPVGASCRDGFGNLADELCVTGACLDLGERGTCSLDCSAATCPPETACATFQAGGSACVAPCSLLTCDVDPGLSCLAPGASGFTVDEVPDPAGYCAPMPAP